MKKMIKAMVAVALISMLAVPAMAATEWNFGASIRFATMYTDMDYGKAKGPDLEGGGAELNGDGKLDWSTQGNSRIKFFMKSDNLQGYAEVGYNFATNAVTTRELWGKYNFGEGWSVTIGQAHQLFNIPGFSNQVWGSDLNMVGAGISFRPPTPKIILSYGGFSFALSEYYNKSISGDKFKVPGVTPTTYRYRADVDSFLPQLQASYQYKADTWGIKLAGAFQTYRLKDIEQFVAGAYTATGKNKTINSWLIDLKGDINFGPAYFKGAASVGENWADAQWSVAGGLSNTYAGVDKGLNRRGFEVANNGKIENTLSWMAAVIAGYRLTESLKFEAGFGYRYDDNDLWHKSSNMYNIYVQAAYTVTPGFTITPEIGYIDLGKTWGTKGDRDSDKDAGNVWYAGAKWQFDF